MHVFADVLIINLDMLNDEAVVYALKIKSPNELFENPPGLARKHIVTKPKTLSGTILLNNEYFNF